MSTLATVLVVWLPASLFVALLAARWLAFSRATVCRCGHHRDAHQHYRAGSDCGLCDCSRFHR